MFLHYHGDAKKEKKNTSQYRIRLILVIAHTVFLSVQAEVFIGAADIGDMKYAHV